ncbi:transglycosylase domain-containing protein [Nocardiopsis gilva]|uniref:transglycosylase domain-containing protein n=1 Tax=Nocardiopsis gilva TaxID=280236 RepID=UPI00034A2CEF|nr:transglycosylase domain-containing protein [Nocardiopsis gilva]
MWKPALVTCALLFIAGVAVLGVMYVRTPDPEGMPAKLEAHMAATTVEFADGSEAVTSGDINRQPVKINEVPPSVKDGVLASEQRNFYEEPGISITGTARAILTGGTKGGGSTITQQMARNYYQGLSQDRSYTRKLKEILIAIKAGQNMAPEKILQQYLNTIYFGRGAYGIQAASQAYFGKEVKDLDYAEGALLGAIIQQPGNFENVNSDEKMEKILRGRWQYSVDGLVEMHENDPKLGLSKEKADQLKFPEIIEWDTGDQYEGYKGYIKTAVANELERRYGLNEQDIATGGYTVKTSLDKDLMEAAGKAFEQVLPNNPEETVEGLAAVDPETGEIKAFHGGDDFTKETDNSLIRTAQAGSSFKPYVLATGLSKDIGLKSVFDGDSPKEFPGLGEPVQNDSNKSYGPVNLVKSTADSINTAYVQLAIEAGPSDVVETAKAAGIRKERFKTAALGPNIALGTYRVSALDQASGFGVFANEGKYIERHMITKVTKRDGKEHHPVDTDKVSEGPKRAFSEDVAADATYAMTQVVEDGGGKSAALPDGRPVAGKTGTSNSAKSAWFVGFTPQLSVAVGLSRTDDGKLKLPDVENSGQGIYGGTTSAKVWRAFMIEAMKGVDQKEFPPPAWVGDEQNFGPEPEPGASESPEPETSQSPEPTASQSPEPTASASPDPGATQSPDPCHPLDTNCEPSEPGGGDGNDRGDGTGDGSDGGGSGNDGNNGNGNGNTGDGGQDDGDGGGSLFNTRE